MDMIRERQRFHSKMRRAEERQKRKAAKLKTEMLEVSPRLRADKRSTDARNYLKFNRARYKSIPAKVRKKVEM